MRLREYSADVGCAFNFSAAASEKANLMLSPSSVLLWTDASCVACPRPADRRVSPGGAIAAEGFFRLMRVFLLTSAQQPVGSHKNAGGTHKNARGQKLSPFELGSHKNVRVGAISAMGSILSHVSYGLHKSHVSYVQVLIDRPSKYHAEYF